MSFLLLYCHFGLCWMVPIFMLYRAQQLSLLLQQYCWADGCENLLHSCAGVYGRGPCGSHLGQQPVAGAHCVLCGYDCPFLHAVSCSTQLPDMGKQPGFLDLPINQVSWRAISQLLRPPGMCGLTSNASVHAQHEADSGKLHSWGWPSFPPRNRQSVSQHLGRYHALVWAVLSRLRGCPYVLPPECATVDAFLG